MRNSFLLFFMFMITLINTKAHAQQIEIGQATDEAITITADTVILKKAIQNMLHDGTLIQQLSIQSFGKYHYLIAIGSYKQVKKIVGVKLVYDINNRLFYAKKSGGYITCTSAACFECSPFKESGQIIGCKCAEKSTISNQCNYTNVEEGTFYQNYVRSKQMSIKSTPNNK